MKFYIFMQCIVVIGLLVPLIGTAELTNGQIPSASNSSIYLSVNEINPRKTLMLSVRVADTVNATIIGANVTLSAVEGDFLSNISGTTNVNGFFNATWKAPQLGFSTLSLVVVFQAAISYSDNDITVNNSIIVKHIDNSAIINSSLQVPTEVFSGETVSFVTSTKDYENNCTPAMQVTYTQPDGIFSAATSGLTDVIGGQFNTSWTAPVLNQLVQNKTVLLIVLIEASDTISLTLTKNITVVHSNATSLTVNSIAPSVLVSGSSVKLLFTVFADSSPAAGGTVSISVDSGHFNNSNTVISLNVNNTGYADVIWTAPILSSNLSCMFQANAEFLLITGQKAFNIIVYPFISDFYVLWSHASSINQTDSLVVAITVKDVHSNTVVQGANVTFLLEMGIWDESEDISCTITTNGSGIAIATFNGTALDLLLVQQEIKISITVNKDLYNTFQDESSFNVTAKPPVYAFQVLKSVDSIQVGDSVILTLRATRNGVPAVNATFYLVASGGTFPDGNSSIRVKTDSTGEVNVTWNSVSITGLSEQTTIYVSVEYVNSGLSAAMIPIVVNPVTDNSSQSSSTPTALDPIAIVGGVAIIMAVVAGAVVVVKKIF